MAHLQNRTSPTLKPSFAKEPPSQRTMTEQQHDRKEARTGNSGFAKKRVQWLIEHSTSHQLLYYVDSFVLRNPLLRKAAKR